ncbi:hypothetical protein BD410DRAFT_893999 [Rickenella mellea]|uniref:Uncharacterized protein n=1 Tax=Rickenella mellea TaxID=50990 RepID=A0A4Y7QL69_9AGAM|nr:hypothetical protein BD410DRAFT_893999 [Rickenella mellea]
MPPAFRPILPITQTPSDADVANAIPNTVQPILKNPAPCANCSSAQQACLIHPPYSPTLCKKCAREHREKCPAHMHRTDAVLWKKQDTESRQAAEAQHAAHTQILVPMEDPSHGGTVTIVLAVPEMTPAATFPVQDGAGLNADDVFEPLVSAFTEDFSISPFTDTDPIPDQNNDELMFNFNELDQQYDLSAIFTLDDNSSQDLIRLTEGDIEPHVSAFVADFVYPQFTDNIPTPEPNNNEMAFTFNDLDQQYDLTAMLTMDDNFQDLACPTEDDLQHLNNTFDELWNEFK